MATCGKNINLYLMDGTQVDETNVSLLTIKCWNSKVGQGRC
jgi:hypothetical protein